MKTAISLRQYRILLLLLDSQDYLKGEDLAKKISVSSRTIRTDISDINNSLADDHIQISSVPGHGYIIPKDCYASVQKILKDNQVFFDRSDRIRHITIKLCLSEEPLDLYDLEDELSISRTTLSNDVLGLKDRFVYAYPHISLHSRNHTIEFEHNEYKRREILNQLMREHWDYNSSGNAYYGHEFISPSLLRQVMEISWQIFDRYGISLEDPSFIAINLSALIAYYRISNGHELQFITSSIDQDEKALSACTEYLDQLEVLLKVTFSDAERLDLYNRIASSVIIKPEDLIGRALSSGFSLKTRKMADDYIRLINQRFQIDLSQISEFYIVLLRFISNLQKPYQYLDPVDFLDIKRNFSAETEFALLFQRICMAHIGRYLNPQETAYLTYAVMGALTLYYESHPAERIRTILLSRLNQNVTWALEKKLNSYFSHFLEFVPSISIYERNEYDFTDIDLILCTAHKKIENAKDAAVLFCSPLLMTADIQNIEQFIRSYLAERMYRQRDIDLVRHLKSGYQHEAMHFSLPQEVIPYMMDDYLNEGIVTPDHLYDIQKTETLSSFAIQPGIVLIYSLQPAQKTRFSILTLEHRILWNGQNIRIVIMASFAADDIKMIFSLKQLIYGKYYNYEMIKRQKSVDGFIEYCRQCELDSE